MTERNDNRPASGCGEASRGPVRVAGKKTVRTTRTVHFLRALAVSIVFNLLYILIFYIHIILIQTRLIYM